MPLWATSFRFFQNNFSFCGNNIYGLEHQFHMYYRMVKPLPTMLGKPPPGKLIRVNLVMHPIDIKVWGGKVLFFLLKKVIFNWDFGNYYKCMIITRRLYQNTIRKWHNLPPQILMYWYMPTHKPMYCRMVQHNEQQWTRSMTLRFEVADFRI